MKKVNQLQASIKARGHCEKGKSFAKGNLHQAIAAVADTALRRPWCQSHFACAYPLSRCSNQNHQLPPPTLPSLWPAIPARRRPSTS